MSNIVYGSEIEFRPPAGLKFKRDVSRSFGECVLICECNNYDNSFVYSILNRKNIPWGDFMEIFN